MPSNSPSNPGHCLAIWLWLDWVDRYCQKEISVTITRFTTAVSSGVVFWSSKRTLLAVRRNTLHHDTNNDSHMLNWRFAPPPPLHYRYRYGRRDFGAGLNLHPETHRSKSLPSPTHPATRGCAQNRPPLPRSVHLLHGFDTSMTPPRPSPPGPQTPPVSQLCRQLVHVNRKADVIDQLSGLFGPLSALTAPAGHDRLETESRDRKDHKKSTSEDPSF